MKTVYNALFVLLLLTVFSGCKEEYIGQYPVDSVAPKQVSNVQVQNMKGRVVLTYTLPEEDDLLCVTARYVLQNGVKREMSSSDRKSTRLNSSHKHRSRMPSSA